MEFKEAICILEFLLEDTKRYDYDNYRSIEAFELAIKSMKTLDDKKSEYKFTIEKSRKPKSENEVDWELAKLHKL